MERKKYPEKNAPIVSARMERKEIEQLEMIARQCGLSRSEFLRQAIQNEIATQREKEGVNYAQ